MITITHPATKCLTKSQNWKVLDAFLSSPVEIFRIFHFHKKMFEKFSQEMALGVEKRW